MPNSIEFNGVSDVFTYDFQAPEPQLVAATTLLIVVRFIGADGTWQSLIESETNAGAVRPSLGRRNTGETYYSDSVTIDSANVVTAADGWLIAAATRPAGAAQTVRFHRCVIGGANTHTDGTGATFSDNSAYLTGRYRIAGNDDFANIRVVAAATWASAALTDGQINGIASAKTSQSILSLSPSWMVESGDSLVLDRSVGGNTSRSAAVGGAASTDTPAGWVYLGAATGSASIILGRKRSRGVSWL